MELFQHAPVSPANCHDYINNTADIASDLVLNLIETTDNYISNPTESPRAILRFGHAETLMPLLSLLHFPAATTLQIISTPLPPMARLRRGAYGGKCSVHRFPSPSVGALLCARRPQRAPCGSAQGRQFALLPMG